MPPNLAAHPLSRRVSSYVKHSVAFYPVTARQLATILVGQHSELKTGTPNPRIPPVQPILNVHSSQPSQLPKKMSARFSSHISSDSGAVTCVPNPDAKRPASSSRSRLCLSYQLRSCTAETAGKPVAKSAVKVSDPFETIKAENDPFETVLSDTPVDASAYVPPKARWDAKQANFDSTLPSPPQPAATDPAASAAPVAKDPCAAAVFKPLNQLGISIAQPTGKAPTDYATSCWNQINAGPSAACRCWPALCYQWDATCLHITRSTSKKSTPNATVTFAAAATAAAIASCSPPARLPTSSAPCLLCRTACSPIAQPNAFTRSATIAPATACRGAGTIRRAIQPRPLAQPPFIRALCSRFRNESL